MADEQTKDDAIETDATAIDENLIVLDTKTGELVPDDQHKPNNRGRAPIVLDLRQLHAVAATFATYEEIAAIFNCSARTLQARFKSEIEKGRAMGRMTYRQEMRLRMKRSDRVLIHMYDKHVEPTRVETRPSAATVTLVGDVMRPLIVREVDEDSDNGGVPT